jgi:hypothetical protein
LSTKRTPLRRWPQPQISDEAVRLFKRMQRLACTCTPIDWAAEYWKGELCAGCKEWWALNSNLCDELALPPWHFPAYEDPRAESPYPPGHANAQPPPLNLAKMFDALQRATGKA